MSFWREELLKVVSQIKKLQASSASGPASSIAGHLASFADATGKVLKDAANVGIGGTAAAPSIDQYRASNALALIGADTFTAQNSAATQKTFTAIEHWLDVATAGNEFAHIGFKTVNAGGSAGTRFSIGGGLYSPSAVGGDKGADSINAVSYYINGNSIFASPAFTGTPTAPTAVAGTATTQIATTAFVQAAGTTGVLVNIQTFTASGTYTPTTGTTKALAILTGGGGGGGGSNAASVGGGGGGAGGTTLAYIASPSTQTVTIGAAGAGGAAGGAGGAGGATSVGTVTANGGAGGASAAANSSGGSGGAATNTGTLGIAGADGQGGVGGYWTNAGFTGAQSYGAGGSGGGSYYGGGAPGKPQAGGSVGANGAAATAYGSGGAGASASSGPSFTGGAGAAGVVIILEFK